MAEILGVVKDKQDQEGDYIKLEKRVKLLHPTGRLSVNMTDTPVTSSSYGKYERGKNKAVKAIAKLIKNHMKAEGKKLPSGVIPTKTEDVELTTIPSMIKKAKRFGVDADDVEDVYNDYVKTQQ